MLSWGNYGLRDVVTCRGTNPEELKKEFEDSVEGYWPGVKNLDKSLKGLFREIFHLTSMHDYSLRAKNNGTSLNAYIDQALRRVVG